MPTSYTSIARNGRLNALDCLQAHKDQIRVVVGIDSMRNRNRPSAAGLFISSRT